MDDFGKLMNAAKFSTYPARATVEVARLPKNGNRRYCFYKLVKKINMFFRKRAGNGIG